MRILLIEDDILIGDGIKTGLSKTGFGVDWFTQGRQEKETLCSTPYNAVILDLTLPGMDGRNILRKWQEKGQRKSVLILTARDTLTEHIEGLCLEAGDYLCKLFALIEAATRLEALMRRTGDQASNELCHGNVILDPDKRIITLTGEPLALKPKEFALLELLMRSAGRVLSHKLIEEKLYTWDEEVTSNAVEVRVHHLRHKLGNGFIRAMHGIGYTLDEE